MKRIKQLRDVLLQEADIAAAPLHVTSGRAKTVEYSVPYMLAGPRILAKTPQGLTVSKFFMLLQPLSAGVWITALVGYVVVSLALYVIWRWSPFEWGSVPTERDVRDSFNLHNSFLYVFSTMLWQGRLFRRVFKRICLYNIMATIIKINSS